MAAQEMGRLFLDRKTAAPPAMVGGRCYSDVTEVASISRSDRAAGRQVYSSITRRTASSSLRTVGEGPGAWSGL